MGYKSISIKLFLFFFSLFSISQFVYAVSKQGSIGIMPYNKDGGSARDWLVYSAIKPGAIIQDAVVVSNGSDEAVTLLVYPVDATNATGGGYAPNSDDAPRVDLGSWIKLDVDKVALGPKESKVVNLTIRVPKKVVPGDHAGTILVRTESSNKKEGGVNIVIRIGVRVYLAVDGPLTPEFKFYAVNLKNDSAQKPYFYFDVENTGNTRLNLSANLELRDKNSKVVQTPSYDLGEVLPFTKVTITRPWQEKIFGDGNLFVKAVVSAGGIKETQTATTSYTMEKKPVEKGAIAAVQYLFGNGTVKVLFAVVIILAAIILFLLRRIIL